MRERCGNTRVAWRRAHGIRLCSRGRSEAGDSAVPPIKAPGGLVAARHRSGWFLTLERDQGVTVSVKFVLLPALFHLTVSEDV
jgi:hypothetical protein